MKKFPCTSCGQCCKNAQQTIDAHLEKAKNNEEYKKSVLFKIIEKAREVITTNHLGHCVHLKEDNSCAIYENRPKLCNVEKMYYHNNQYQIGSTKETAKKIVVSKTDYFKINADVCNRIQKQAGVSENFRVKVK